MRIRLWLLAASTLLLGCKIVVVSGPVVVSVGDTVEYVLEISSISVFGAEEPIFVQADVPQGWELVSSTYDGTVGGAPVAGDALVVQSAQCDLIVGAVRPGYRRWSFRSPQLPPGLTSADTAEVTLRFTAVSQPAGELRLYFVMGTNNECSTTEVLAINRQQEPRFLRWVETFFDGVDDVDGLSRPAEVTVARDGRNVYVASERFDSSIAVFARHPISGRLAFLEAESEGVSDVEEPVAVRVSPDGSHVYAASRGTSFDEPGAIAVFARDPVTGELVFLDSVVLDSALEGLGSLAVSPDGEQVYVSYPPGSSWNLAVFSRNDATGLLSFLELLTPGGELALTLDGRHAYLTDEDELHVLSRDTATGALSLLDSLSTGFQTMSALSPDGRHLYAVSDDDSIVVYGRDEVTGLLSPFQTVNDLTGEPIGWVRAYSIAVSPTGDHVAVGSSVAVSVFRRDASTGELTFVENHFSGNVATGGWDRPRALAFSPLGRHLYGTSVRDGSLVVFETPVLFRDGFELGTTAGWSVTVPPPP